MGHYVALRVYVYIRRVFASQTPFKMRAPLANRRLAHSTWIRTGALYRRYSTGVSTGDDRRSSAPIAGYTRIRGQRPLRTYVGLVAYLRTVPR